MSGKPNDKWIKTMVAKHGSLEAVIEVQRGIGQLGGLKSRGGGFAYGDHTLAKEAGSTGGKRGKRGFKLLEDLGTKGKYLNKVTNEVVVLSYGS